MIDLDERLDRAAHDLWAVMPTDARAALASRRSRRARLMVGAAAVATVVVTIGAVWAWRDVPADDADPAANPPVTAPQTTVAQTPAPPTTVVPPTAVVTAVSGDDLPAPGSILTSEGEYVIQEGDYPATVATMWGVAFEDLATLNGWTLEENGIVPEWPGVGATIRIPAGATVPGGVDGDALETQPAFIDVTLQKMQVTLASALTCEEPYRTQGTFDSFDLELFSDRGGERWLMRATFPDSSTYELVATGSVIYPDSLFERGTWKGAAVGCAPDRIIGWTPGQGSISALNLVPELADDEVAYFAGDVAADTVTLGDERITTLGFRGTAFQSVINGFTSDADGEHAMTQTTTWIVADGTVIERIFENRVDGSGVATVVMAMIGHGGVQIEASAFDTDGMTPLAPLERPATPPRPPVPDSTPSAVATCGTYTVVAGDAPAMVATKLDITFDALQAVNVDTPGWDQWFPGLVINVPC